MVMVECSNGTLTFDIEVDFETVVVGSTATGNAYVKYICKRPVTECIVAHLHYTFLYYTICCCTTI